MQQRTKYARKFLATLIEMDFVLKDNSVVLPPNQFIDLLNHQVEDLYYDPVILSDEQIGYNYHAVYNSVSIQTITENKITDN